MRGSGSRAASPFRAGKNEPGPARYAGRFQKQYYRPFPELGASELYNSNTGAEAVLELAENEPEIRGLVVVEQGEIVAEYYRDGIEPSTLSPIHSCTKSWISLLLGVMEKNGLISLNETLGDIWPDNNTWKNVDHADYRRSVNIESLLTMTAGLKMRL